jgi:hypothetical protein
MHCLGQAFWMFSSVVMDWQAAIGAWGLNINHERYVTSQRFENGLLNSPAACPHIRSLLAVACYLNCVRALPVFLAWRALLLGVVGVCSSYLKQSRPATSATVTYVCSGCTSIAHCTVLGALVFGLNAVVLRWASHRSTHPRQHYEPISL